MIVKLVDSPIFVVLKKRCSKILYYSSVQENNYVISHVCICYCEVYLWWSIGISVMHLCCNSEFIYSRGCRGRDRTVVRFTTTYAISAYHRWSSYHVHGKVYSIQHYIIKLSITCGRSVIFSKYSGFLHL